MDRCVHQPECPGCPRFMQGGISGPTWQQLEALVREIGAEAPTLHPGPLQHYRVRARLAVRGTPRDPRIGIFEAGTHRVAAIGQCPIHHPVVNVCTGALRDAIVETGSPVFDEARHGRGVRYVQIVVQRRSKRAQVVVVTNDPAADPVASLMESLATRLEPHLHSLYWNGNTGRGNAILGSEFHRFSGPEAVHEPFAGASVYFPPGAFGQSNLDLAEQIAGRIHTWVAPGTRVAEFYCGVGAIGLGVAASVAELRMNELGEGSLRGLELGLTQLHADVRARVAVARGSAGSASNVLDGVDVAIVDPPRKGLDAGLLDALCQRGPPEVAYLSCGLTSLERDARALTRAGYQVVETHAYDLFPHTEHVETLMRLRR